MNENKFLLAWAIANASLSVIIAILAFLGVKYGKNELKKTIGMAHSVLVIFWLLVIFPPGPWIFMALLIGLWLLWAGWTLKDVINIKS